MLNSLCGCSILAEEFLHLVRLCSLEVYACVFPSFSIYRNMLQDSKLGVLILKYLAVINER